jgi:hypothetical protein
MRVYVDARFFLLRVVIAIVTARVVDVGLGAIVGGS